MKKILSVMLAIMMLFGALSLSASAADSVYDEMFQIQVPNTNNTIASGGHLILEFDFGPGKSKLPLPVYSNGIFVETAEVTGTYYMLPTDYNKLVAGAAVQLPSVQAADTDDFVGWYCYADKEYYTSGEYIERIPDEWFTANNGSRVVKFQAKYEPREPEGDTMATVLGILSKVFGTILGLLFFDGNASQGVALIEKILGGIM